MDKLYDQIPDEWKIYYDKNDIDVISDKLNDIDNVIYPKDIFNFLRYFKPIETKVVIVAQDPYHDGNALGYAFGVEYDKKINPSLRNILTEVENNYKNFIKDTTLRHWLSQGVLLLNKSLTVEKSKPNSHSKIWKKVTRKFVQRLSEYNTDLVFMLWGNEAKELSLYIDDHKILEATHPSPYAANTGKNSFMGCNHFKLCNNFLKEKNKKEIEW